MYKDLEKQMISVAENYAKLIDGTITKAKLEKAKDYPEIEMRRELYEIASNIRILNHMVTVVAKMNRISQGNN